VSGTLLPPDTLLCHIQNDQVMIMITNLLLNPYSYYHSDIKLCWDLKQYGVTMKLLDSFVVEIMVLLLVKALLMVTYKTHMDRLSIMIILKVLAIR